MQYIRLYRKMKITIEISDITTCAFLNYIYYINTGMNMTNRQIDTDEIQSNKVIVCNPETWEGI